MGFGGILRQSTSVDVLIGPFVDSTDGDTEETALTIAQADVRVSKNGQPAAQKSDVTTCAHDADGFYNCELDATDSNTVGQLTLFVHVAGALAVRHDYQVIEEAVYDALFAASATGALPVSAGGIVAASFGAGAIDAAAIADNAIDAGAIASNAITAAKIASDAITAAKIATDAITAAKIANGAIDAATFAADVDAEILSYLVDDATRLDASELNGLDNKIGTPFNATVSADLLQINTNVAVTHAAVLTVDDFVDTEVTSIINTLGVAGAGLTAVPWNASWDAQVESEVADALEATIADSIPADGSRPSVKQALYMLTQFMVERAVSSTTCTVKKPDGSTTLFTLTLNDSVTPTSITRST